MTSILDHQPPKIWPFPIKIGVNGVPGVYIYKRNLFIYYTHQFSDFGRSWDLDLLRFLENSGCDFYEVHGGPNEGGMCPNEAEAGFHEVLGCCKFEDIQRLPAHITIRYEDIVLFWCAMETPDTSCIDRSNRNEKHIHRNFAEAYPFGRRATF